MRFSSKNQMKSINRSRLLCVTCRDVKVCSLYVIRSKIVRREALGRSGIKPREAAKTCMN
jgi:hypothetical protein